MMERKWQFQGKFSKRGFYEIFLRNKKIEIPPFIPIIYSNRDINRIRIGLTVNNDLVIANKWARDEKNIRQVIDSTYGMHGDLKGILAGVIPQIKGLEIYDGDDAQLQLLDGEK